MDQPHRVIIGQITAAHGVHGEVRVFPLTDFPERWRQLTQAYVGGGGAPVGVCWRSFQGHMVILNIDGVGDRTAAEKLRGAYIEVDGTSTHPLPEGTYYIFQLRGLQVVDLAGNRLGHIHDVEESPASHLLVIRLPDGRTARVPMVRSLVRSVDLDGGFIAIDPIPGLLE